MKQRGEEQIRQQCANANYIAL